ncbi:MAG TPA: thermonuclease family protein [Acidimicrobiales bacterium]|jgi:micrococcal nuclease
MVRWISVVCIALIASGCSHHAAAAADGKATVTRVIDGDTIVVQLGGTEEHVRLIGIDTPETHKPGTPVECYGPEAAAHLTELLPVGTNVRLERDREARDKYGRLLAYVYREPDGVFLELEMVQAGFAGPLAIAPNTTHRAEIDAAVATARAAGRGLWGACGGFHVPGGG